MSGRDRRPDRRPETSRRAGLDVRIALPVAMDTLVVLVFASVGRRSHDESGAITSVLFTAWPFLAGMAVGWLVSLVAFRNVPTSVVRAIPVWLSTVALGMALRAMTGRGTAPAFVLVATVTLGVLLLGWRWLVAWTRRMRQPA